MTEPAIIGVGATQFGNVMEDEELKGKTFEEICADAAFEAMDDANVEGADVDAFYVGNMLQSTSQISSHATVLADWLGLQLKGGFHFDTACSTGNTGLGIAHSMVKAGKYDTVLVVGGEITSSEPIERDQLKREALDPQELWYLTDIGVDTTYAYKHAYDVATAYGAIPTMGFAERHGLEMDEMDEVMYHVSRLAKEHASMTPKAARHETLEDMAADYGYDDTVEFWKSDHNPFFAWPTRQLSALTAVDGASACIVTNEPEEYTDKLPIEINGFDWTTKSYPWYGDEPGVFPQDEKAFERAYAMADIEGPDIDYLYVHDCMQIYQPTLGEMSGYLEDPVDAFMNEETRFDGEKPMNVTGGRHGVGHAWEASAGFETYEIVKQMRGEMDRKQISPEPETAVQHNHGYGMHTAVTVMQAGA